MKSRNSRLPRSSNPWTKNFPENFPVLILRKLHHDLGEVFPELRSIPELRDRDHLERWSRSLQSIEVDAPWQFAILRQLQELIRKFQWKGDRDLTEAAALAKLKECEGMCRETNRLLRTPPLFIHELREEICKLLPILDFDEVCHHARHGPGVSHRKAKGTSKYSKFSETPYTVSTRASGYLESLLTYDDRWRGALEDLYRSSAYRSNGINAYIQPLPLRELCKSVILPCNENKITTVPKDDHTDRPIAIEPVLNCYMQLGIDGVLRKAMRRRWGVDLNDQTRNGYLAYVGSRNGNYATIDLSSASDLVSLRLVYLLFPSDWFKLLYSLRSPYGLLPDGTRIKYSKFSSMGNGATFILESIIFGAIARVATVKSGFPASDCSVYGDDIIVRSTAYYRCSHMLSACGFELNRKKSFHKGPFRESCGMDWYNGTYVRPVYIKNLRDINDLMTIHNRLRFWSYTVLGDSDVLSGTLQLLRSYSNGDFDGPENMLDFSSSFHGPKNNRNRIRRVVEKQRPTLWFFGRLLASHRPTSGDFVSRGNTVEDLAYKAFLRKHGLPDKKSSGSVYDVIERQTTRRYRKQIVSDETIVPYQDPVQLLNSLHGF